ncbi:MAG: hypothetical protein WDN69_03430 [Aliidongia sp.]
MADGEEQPVTSTIGIEFAGIGTLTVRPYRDDRQADDLAKAEARRRDLLNALGVDTLAEARQRDAAARDEKAKIELARQRLSLLAPKGIGAVRTDIARLERASQQEIPAGSGLDLEVDTERAQQALDEAERQVAASRNAVRETRPARDDANGAVVDAEKALAAILAELAGIEATLGPMDLRAERETALSQEFASADTAFSGAEEQAKPLRASRPDLGNAAATLRRTRSITETAGQEIAKIAGATRRPQWPHPHTLGRRHRGGVARSESRPCYSRGARRPIRPASQNPDAVAGRAGRCADNRARSLFRTGDEGIAPAHGAIVRRCFGRLRRRFAVATKRPAQWAGGGRRKIERRHARAIGGAHPVWLSPDCWPATETPRRSFSMTHSSTPTTTGSRRCSTHCTGNRTISKLSSSHAASAPSHGSAATPSN